MRSSSSSKWIPSLLRPTNKVGMPLYISPRNTPMKAPSLYTKALLKARSITRLTFLPITGLLEYLQTGKKEPSGLSCQGMVSQKVALIILLIKTSSLNFENTISGGFLKLSVNKSNRNVFRPTKRFFLLKPRISSSTPVETGSVCFYNF